MKSMLLLGGFLLFLSVSLLTRLCLFFCLIVCSVQDCTSTAPYEYGYTGPGGKPFPQTPEERCG